MHPSANWSQMVRIVGIQCPRELSFFPRQQPEDIVNLLNTKLKDAFMTKGVFFRAEYVTNVRNFTDCLPQLSTLAGAFKKRSLYDSHLVPHSFAYVRRDAMPEQLLEEAQCRLPRRYDPSPSDVFCLIKAFVSDDSLCQPPFICFPGCMVHVAQEAMNKVARNQVPGVAVCLDSDRKAVLCEIASYLEQNYTQYARGVLYLRQLAGTVARSRTPAPQLPWLLQGPGVERHLCK